MSAKRSRSGRSSSFGDSGGLNQLLQPSSAAAAAAESSNPRLHLRTAFSNGAKVLKPSLEAEQSSPSVLTMSTPEIVMMGREPQVDKFLEQCYFCRRRLPHNEDVFMCGPFRAFCSPECRDQQVDIDKITEQPNKGSAESATSSMRSKSNNVNGG